MEQNFAFYRFCWQFLERPKGYTKNELAERYGVSPDTIKGDINTFRNAGFIVEPDTKYRYYFKESNTYKKLKNLLHFTEEDQFILEQAIDNIAPHSKRAKQLKQKLGTLYDYKKLGHSYLRKPYLKKVDALLLAKEEEKQVRLIDYKVFSLETRFPTVLLSHFTQSPPDDMLHAYDINKKALRHFRISRFNRVEVLDQPWKYKNYHNVILADPFRIVEKNQVLIHLRIAVGAYNELIERFPLTQKLY